MVLIRNMRTVDLDFFVNVVIVRNVTSLFHDLKRYYERLEKFERNVFGVSFFFFLFIFLFIFFLSLDII